MKERRTELTVVFVTDGIFDGGPAGALRTIETCQKWRTDNGFARAVVIAYGIGAATANLQHMHTIGAEGGFFVAEDPPVIAPAAKVQGIAPAGSR